MVLRGAHSERCQISESTPLRKSKAASIPEVSLTVREDEEVEKTLLSAEQLK